MACGLAGGLKARRDGRWKGEDDRDAERDGCGDKQKRDFGRGATGRNTGGDVRVGLVHTRSTAKIWVAHDRFARGIGSQ